MCGLALHRKTLLLQIARLRIEGVPVNMIETARHEAEVAEAARQYAEAGRQQIEEVARPEEAPVRYEYEYANHEWHQGAQS